MLTAGRYLDGDPKLGSLRTTEDVKRCIAARRAAMLGALLYSSLQYYFLTIGLEIVSMPSLTVFVPMARLG